MRAMDCTNFSIQISQRVREEEQSHPCEIPFGAFKSRFRCFPHALENVFFRKLRNFKAQIERDRSQHEKNMKVLYAKIEKVKKLNNDENLSDYEKRQIMSLLDQKDPKQKKLVEFFGESKASYAMKRIMEDDEKTKKSARLKAN